MIILYFTFNFPFTINHIFTAQVMSTKKISPKMLPSYIGKWKIRHLKTHPRPPFHPGCVIYGEGGIACVIKPKAIIGI